MNQTSTAQSEHARALKDRLRQQLRWLRYRLIGHAALMLVGGCGLLLAAAVLSSPAWTSWGPWGAHVVRGVLVVCGLWILVFEVIQPLRKIANLKGFTRELERHGKYDNMLEAATQFTSPRREDPLKAGASPVLVAEILRRARLEAEATTLAPRIPLVGVAFHALVASVALLLWLGIGVGMPERVGSSFAALGTPERLDRGEPREGIYALTGDLRVPVGSTAELTARDFVGGAIPVFVQINRSGDFWQELPTELRSAPQSPPPYHDAVAVLEDVEDPFRYRFRKGSLLTPAFAVSLRERPVLKQFSARLTPPAYTGRPPRELAEVGGTISVLEGTQVELSGTASTPLSEASRLPEEGAPIPLAVEGDRFTDQLTIAGDTSFRIRLVDSEGLPNEAITVYRFAARPDDPPTVQLTRPAEDLSLDRDLQVAIAGLAADDVGLAALDLLHRNSEEVEWTRVPLFRPGGAVPTNPAIADLATDQGENEVAVGFRWELSDMELFPGDTVLYCLEATDNNALEGGQTARSGVFRLSLPTIAEVFDLERMEREAQGDDLTQLLEEGKDLEETLERLDRELKKNPNPDWAKQQEIRDALERQQALNEKLEESSGELRQNMENFEKNNAGSMELLQKMETIQDLMENLQDPGLQAYMEAMEEAMDQVQPHELQRAMEEALENQEDRNRRLDRTIELLRQLERERTMSDLVEEVAEYLSRQENLEEETARSEDAAGEDAEGEEGEEGESADGEQNDGEQSDGEQSEGEQSEGEQSEGEQSDGEQSDGEQSDGEQSDGEQSDGEQSEGEQSEGEQSEGEQSEGEQSPPMSEEEIAAAQEQLAQEAKELEERIRETLEELKKQQQEGGSDDPSAQEMKKSLQEAMEQMSQKGKPSESMEAAQEKLNEGDRNQAKEDQEEAQRRLVHLYEVLAEGQQSMQQATGQAAVEKLQQTAYDLLNLSFGEEKIVDSLQDSARGQRLAPITREQGRIHRNTVRIYESLEELARKNFMIPEQLLGSIRDLVDSLEQSVQELQMSRSRRSRATAEQTMGQMNKIVMNLLTMAMNAGGQGGGGGSGQGSASQQMQQMSQDQSRLNSMTQELRKKLSSGGLSADERKQMAQLRAQQQAIREQLQQLRQGEELGDERRVLGDLDHLTEEMEDVAEQLEGGRIDANLERRQEKILSRLLDAQRSIREREFAKRRESREGQELYTPQEGAPLLTDRTDHEQQLRRWLAPEKAPHAYQDDVRRYFRKIQGALEGTEKR